MPASCRGRTGRPVEPQPRDRSRLELALRARRVAEQHDRAIVARNRGEVLERVHRRGDPPERHEVARHLLLHGCGDLQEVARRDLAGQRDQRDVVGERHEHSLRCYETRTGWAIPDSVGTLGEMLEQSQIAHYLLSLGLVKPRAIVEEDLTVVDASRRNCVFIATTREGPTYVVKQAGPRSCCHARARSRRPARLRRRVRSSQGTCRRSSTTTPEAALLVLRSPAGARDWASEHGGGRFSAGPGRCPRSGPRRRACNPGRGHRSLAGRLRPPVGTVTARAVARARCST